MDKKTELNRYIRRADAWHIIRTFSFHKGTLTLTDETLTYDEHSVSTEQDIVIPLRNVEKVKITQKKLLFQCVGIYAKDSHYVFQVQHGQAWVDEISEAVRRLNHANREPAEANN